jgi:hypothetical protein
MNETVILGQQILDQLYAAFQAFALFVSLGGAIWYFAAKPFLAWRDQWRAQRAAATPPPPKPAPVAVREPADERTNGRTDGVLMPKNERTILELTVERLKLDRNRQAVILALVSAGWNTTEIRGVVRGANDTIGTEVDEAKATLDELRANPPSERLLTLRQNGEEKKVPWQGSLEVKA